MVVIHGGRLRLCLHQCTNINGIPRFTALSLSLANRPTQQHTGHPPMNVAARPALTIVTAVAALLAVGCTPRSEPDMSARRAPVAAPVAKATLAVTFDGNGSPTANPDGPGKGVAVTVLAVLPLVSAINPSYGVDNSGLNGAESTLKAELVRTGVATIVPANEKGGYAIKVDVTGRSQSRCHSTGFGIAYYLALLPALFNVPRWTLTSEADMAVSVDSPVGKRILDRSFDRSLVWRRGAWDYDARVDVPAMQSNNENVVVPELSAEVAAAVAEAIAADAKK